MNNACYVMLRLHGTPQPCGSRLRAVGHSRTRVSTVKLQYRAKQSRHSPTDETFTCIVRCLQDFVANNWLQPFLLLYKYDLPKLNLSQTPDHYTPNKSLSISDTVDCNYSTSQNRYTPIRKFSLEREAGREGTRLPALD